MFDFHPAPHHRLEIHLLKAHGASNLNRDDVGRPKELFYGGKRRLRLSSQSIKAAIRKGDSMEAFLRTVTDGDRMIRTGFVADLIAEELERGYQESIGADTRTAIARELANTMAKFEEKKGKTQLVATSKKELRHILDRLLETDEPPPETPGENDKAVKTWLDSGLKRLKKEGESRWTRGDFTPEIQLFGRMMTGDDFFAPVDSALQVAHAFTTHEVPVERDYWVAVDDLRKNFDEMLIKPKGPDAEKKLANRHAGSSMIETRRFGSGVFYHYYCIDLDLLFANMRSAWHERLEGVRIAEMCSQLVGYFTMAAIGENPQGYQTSLTSHATAEAVAAGIGSGFPISAASAFESAVAAKDGSGFLAPSAERLHHWLEQRQEMQGEWAAPMLTAGFADSERNMPNLVRRLAEAARQGFGTQAER